VAVQACTLVAGGNVGQLMRCFEAEFFEDLHLD
jgi:hypothetical protein